jgi:hypothetical protein
MSIYFNSGLDYRRHFPLQGMYQLYAVFTKMQDKVFSLNFLLKCVRSFVYEVLMLVSAVLDHAEPDCAQPNQGLNC